MPLDSRGYVPPWKADSCVPRERIRPTKTISTPSSKVSNAGHSSYEGLDDRDKTEQKIEVDRETKSFEDRSTQKPKVSQLFSPSKLHDFPDLRNVNNNLDVQTLPDHKEPCDQMDVDRKPSLQTLPCDGLSVNPGVMPSVDSLERNLQEIRSSTEQAHTVGQSQKSDSESSASEDDDTFTSASDSDDSGVDEDLPNKEAILMLLDKEGALSDEELNMLLDALGLLEGNAAEAEETLEEESLERIKKDVFEELSEDLDGEELETQVDIEMEILVEKWSRRHSAAQKLICSLLEKLDGEGVNLGAFYKSVEAQLASTCKTEAWKTRTHWVGGSAQQHADWKVEAELDMAIRPPKPTDMNSDDAAEADSELDDDFVEIGELEDLDTASCPKNIKPWQLKRALKNEEERRVKRTTIRKVHEKQDEAKEDKQKRRQRSRKRNACPVKDARNFSGKSIADSDLPPVKSQNVLSGSIFTGGTTKQALNISKSTATSQEDAQNKNAHFSVVSDKAWESSPQFQTGRTSENHDDQLEPESGTQTTGTKKVSFDETTCDKDTEADRITNFGAQVKVKVEKGEGQSSSKVLPQPYILIDSESDEDEKIRKNSESEGEAVPTVLPCVSEPEQRHHEVQEPEIVKVLIPESEHHSEVQEFQNPNIGKEHTSEPERHHSSVKIHESQGPKTEKNVTEKVPENKAEKSFGGVASESEMLPQEQVTSTIANQNGQSEPILMSQEQLKQSTVVQEDSDFPLNLMKLSIRALRKMVEECGGNLADCLEKSDLVTEYLRVRSINENIVPENGTLEKDSADQEHTEAGFSDGNTPELRRSRRISARCQPSNTEEQTPPPVRIVELDSDGEREIEINPFSWRPTKLEACSNRPDSRAGDSKSERPYYMSEMVRSRPDFEQKTGKVDGQHPSMSTDQGKIRVIRTTTVDMHHFCTACGTSVSPRDVYRHPLLLVLVCRKCLLVYSNNKFKVDEVGVEDDCRWCGHGGSVIICDNPDRTCNKVFCENCVVRNFGKKELDVIQEDHWKCYACNPKPLESLRVSYEAAKESRMEVMDCGMDDDITFHQQQKRRRRDVEGREHNQEKQPKKKKKEKNAVKDTSLNQTFCCTICEKFHCIIDVKRHPLIGVAICAECLNHYENHSFIRDTAGFKTCRWCTRHALFPCKNPEKPCRFSFCTPCNRKYLGYNALNLALVKDWRCIMCRPEALERLQAPYKNFQTILQNHAQASSTNYENIMQKDPLTEDVKNSRKPKAKMARKIMDESEEVQLKQALEQERQERVALRTAKAAERASKSRKVMLNQSANNVDAEEYDDEEDDPEKGISINKARDDNEECVRIAPELSLRLKPHQIEGIRFMWNNCIDSVQKVKEGNQGVGCILAHCMGLGKTLQVVTFIHTVLRCEVLKLKTVLIVVPSNVLFNWKNEFLKWQSGVDVYMLDDVKRSEEDWAAHTEKWHNNGGVLLLGYTAFNILSSGKNVKEKKARDTFWATLVLPGPDLLICDEAHLIKNPQAQITKALGDVNTKRKIALTGSPLQNNLAEYYCMVDFVRKGHLGDLKDFRNRYENPIKRGQHKDADRSDAQKMKRRIFALSHQLRGFVQRKGSSYLESVLPPKHVYVVAVRLCPLQRVLYRRFLTIYKLAQQSHSFGHLSAFVEAIRICNHPELVRAARRPKRDPPEADQKVLSDNDGDKQGVTAVTALTTDNDIDEELQGQTVFTLDEAVRNCIDPSSNASGSPNSPSNKSPESWWEDIMAGQPENDLSSSGKMILLMDILEQTSKAGEKVLVFSHSLETLDLIEVFLSSLFNGQKKNWKKNWDYYRIDGKVSSKKRQGLVDRFNDYKNQAVKCMLISTKAGGMGINLTAANRVVLMDGSWNPTHDLQAVYRVWRFGQTKEVAAYRLVSCGTMEEKVYHRQVSKEGLAARVVDSHYVARHFTNADLELLYNLDDDGDNFQFDKSEWVNLPSIQPGEEDLLTNFVNVKGETAAENSTPPPPPVGKTCPVDGTGKSSSPPFSPPLESTSGGGRPELSVEGEGRKSELVRRVGSGSRAFSIPDGMPPKDPVLQRLLLKHRPKWIVRYHEHGHLLRDLEEEKLTEEEEKAAWNEVVQEFDAEEKAEAMKAQFLNHTNQNFQTNQGGQTSQSGPTNQNGQAHQNVQNLDCLDRNQTLSEAFVAMMKAVLSKPSKEPQTIKVQSTEGPPVNRK